MINKIVTAVIAVVSVVVLVYLLKTFVFVLPVPVEDTSADLINEISSIDRNTTNEIDSALDATLRGTRGRYE